MDYLLHLIVGLDHSSKGRSDSAVISYREAIRHFDRERCRFEDIPEACNPHFLLGMSLFSTKQYQESLLFLDTALLFSPGYRNIQLFRTVDFYCLKRYPEAVEASDRYFEMAAGEDSGEMENTVRILRGMAHFDQGNFSAALLDLNNAEDSLGGSYSFDRLTAALELNENTESHQAHFFRKAAEDTGSPWLATFAREMAAGRTPDETVLLREARETAAKKTDAAEEEIKSACQIRYMLGELALRTGEMDQALAYFRSSAAVELPEEHCHHHAVMRLARLEKPVREIPGP